MKTRYKFLRLVDNKIKSESGNCTWTVDKWQKIKGNVDMCNNGFHCSKKVYEAFSYVQGEILAKVEVGGDSDVQDDKEVYSEMRIIKAWKWTKTDSVSLAIYAAELVIDIFEKQYPDDKRPRQAIEAAKKYLKDPSEKNRDAARDAAGDAGDAAWDAARTAGGAAWAAGDASWAAWDAARAARAAGDAAWDAARAAGAAARDASWAAWDAARAARAAGDAAWDAAGDAARAALLEKIDIWMTKRIKQLEKYGV